MGILEASEVPEEFLVHSWVPRLIAISLLLASAGFVVACEDEVDEPEPATGGEPAATATAESEDPTATPSVASPEQTPLTPEGGPEAPGKVSLTGPLPDLNTPVPPGGGELGRLTISWTDNSEDEQGFRVYQECDGDESVLLEVPRDETSYGPVQTCRPGRVGVAAYNAEGESEIVWAE
jgi:hypothetical protein